MTTTTLTKLEANVLRALITNAENEAGGDFGIMETVGYAAIEGISGFQAFGGVVSSLQKKGLVTVHEKFNPSGQRGKEFWITQFTLDEGAAESLRIYDETLAAAAKPATPSSPVLDALDSELAMLKNSYDLEMASIRDVALAHDERRRRYSDHDAHSISSSAQKLAAIAGRIEEVARFRALVEKS